MTGLRWHREPVKLFNASRISTPDPQGVGRARRWPLYALVAVMFGAMLMRLAPLTEFSLWGSDWGEYFHLTERLVEDGHHLERNLGWGRAYVDFPGLFDLTGAVALMTGLPVSSSMLYVIPCVTAISCLLVACVVLRLGGGPWAALVSASLLAVVFPEVFTNSHPVPGALGSVLLLGILLVYLLGDTWRREDGVDAERPIALFGLYMLIILALMVTHHMSHFFLILVLGMAYLLRTGLVHGGEPERAWWGIWTLTGALAMATGYWLGVAKTFREEVMVDLAHVPGYAMIAIAWVVLAVLFVLGVLLRRRRRGMPALSFWGVKELSPSVVLYLAVGTVVIALVATFGFPGTEIETGWEIFLYAIPTVVAFVLLIGSTDVALMRGGGHAVVGWVAVITMSFLAMSALGNDVLVPYRHIPYIAEGLVVLAGLGAVHLFVMFKPRGGPSRASALFTAVLAVVLVAALVMTAFPPKAVMGGFEEGTLVSEASASMWLRGGLPAPGAVPEDSSSGVVVTDHRLSSIVYGIGGQMATWDEGGPVLHGPADETTWAVMEDIDTPHGDRRVTAVVLSEDFRTGAALSQVEGPMPVEGEAWDKFFDLPFYTVYDGGDVWVMVVVRPLDTTGEP